MSKFLDRQNLRTEIESALDRRAQTERAKPTESGTPGAGWLAPHQDRGPRQDRVAPAGGKCRVLVAQPPQFEGATEVTSYAWEDCTEAQALAYANGVADWRKAGAAHWYSRLWRRLTRGDAG